MSDSEMYRQWWQEALSAAKTMMLLLDEVITERDEARNWARRMKRQAKESREWAQLWARQCDEYDALCDKLEHERDEARRHIIDTMNRSNRECHSIAIRLRDATTRVDTARNAALEEAAAACDLLAAACKQEATACAPWNQNGYSLRAHQAVVCASHIRALMSSDEESDGQTQGG